MADKTYGGEVVVRRATPGDRDDVIDIREDVYDGTDYLPTIYEQLVDSEANYVAYVAVLDGKLVILECMRWTQKQTRHCLLLRLTELKLEDGRLQLVIPEGRKRVAFTSFGMVHHKHVSSVLAMRVRPGYEGRGLTRLLRRKLLTDFPSITHFVYDGFVTPASAEKLKKCQRLMSANVCVYDIDGAELTTLYDSTPVQSSSAHRELSCDNDLQQFVSSGRCQRFLSHHTIDYVPMGYAFWEPVHIGDEKQLMGRMTQLRTLITETPQSKNEIRALSFSGGIQLKTRLKYGHVLAHIYFYGEDIATLRDHVVNHMHHLVTTVCRQEVSLTTNSCRNTRLYLLFPSTLNSADVNAVLRAGSGQGEQTIGVGRQSRMFTSEVYMALEPAS